MANSRKFQGALRCFFVLVPLGFIAPLHAKPVLTLLPVDTQANAINDSGVVVGTVGFGLGFVRTPDGMITSFKAEDSNSWTTPQSINNSGVTAGSYLVSNTLVTHGFVRAADGTIADFDAPGAGAQQYEGTWATGINASGIITGYYAEESGYQHGLVRATDGSFTFFDVPGAMFTEAWCINDKGVIAGYWFADGSSPPHGFVRSATGKITSFDPPGASNGTYANAVNVKGAITGIYMDDARVAHGYIRQPSGAFTTFDIASGPIVRSMGINAKGTVTGVGGYTKAGFAGFVRYQSGKMAVINTPKSDENDANGINTDGVVVGTAQIPAKHHQTNWYGFIWTP